MAGKRPMVASVHGMVAAAHPLAAQAGARILGHGGNAFDAVAATAAALNVVEPFMSGLAGIGVATCFIASEQRVRILDFVPRVPAGFKAGAYARREDIERGAHAVSTPGSLAGWCELVEAHGSMPLHEVFAPAIALAADGFPLSQFGADRVNAAAAVFRGLGFFEEWNNVYTAGRGAVVPNQVLRQPDLARTLGAIAEQGPSLLYSGTLGAAVARHVAALGGSVTLDDLASVQAQWKEPLSAPYRDCAVHAPGPPSEAFQYLLTLQILDGFDLAALEPNGADHLDLVWRAIRIAAGERVAHNKPGPEVLSRLFSPVHIDRLRAWVSDRLPIEGPTEQWLPSEPDPRREHTTSMSVADGAGNVVCLTQSLGLGFGSGVVVPGTGICLNNALHWGDVDIRASNALLPGAELAFPTAPSIVTRAGLPVLALGTPGSYGISQTQAQALVQRIDFGLDIQDAIEAPRARLWDGRRVSAEGRIGPSVLAELVRRGHEVETAADWTLLTGGMQGIAIDPETKAMIGGADPRREGYAATP